MRSIVFFLGIIVIAVLGGLSLTAFTEPYAFGEVVAEAPSPAVASTTVHLLPALPLSILFTGDVMLGRRVETLMDTYGAGFPFTRMPYLQELGDYVIVNFEAAAPNVHRHTPDLTFRFSVDQAYLPALRAAGVTHASLANNHSYDTGMSGFAETYVALEAAEITPFGDNQIASTSVTTLSSASTSVTVVGIHLVDEPLNIAALTQLLETTPSTTYQIAYVHWGPEYVGTHSSFQGEQAKALVALGFDAIIGHHPHVVQDIDVIDGVPVFYSLGNFVFDQYFSQSVQEGLLLRLEATSTSLSFTLLPHTSLDARTQPRLLDGEEKALFLNNLATLSTTSLAAQIQSGVILVR